MALHLIIASFMILFIAFYVIFYTTKGKVDTELLAMLKDVLEYDFYIVLSGLGFITADNTVKLITERSKAKIPNPPIYPIETPPQEDNFIEINPEEQK